jgi:penicillin amidase
MTASKWAKWERGARFLAVAAVAVACCMGSGVQASGLDEPASIVYDPFRVPTIVAATEHDALFLQGYQHARDRLFQMDFQRRAFAGKLAEMFGPSILAQDVQLRTLGLDRAAQRSLAVQTPEVLAWLQAYSDGVNAYLADPANPLPLEYSLIELDRDGIPPWTPFDCLITAKGLAFNLAFDLGDIDNTFALLNFRGVGELLGFNGLQLFTVDLYPVRPFDTSISIPPSLNPEPGDPPADEEYPDYLSDPNFESLLLDYREAIEDIPMLQRALDRSAGEEGSNWWVASGALTDSGYPIIANDPHLALDSPATFYEVHLSAADTGLNVAGVSFPGAPGIVQGCNDTVCWGSTNNPMDVTDIYQEVLLALDPSNPTLPTHTYFQGVPEPLQYIPQAFFFNVIGDGVLNNTLNAGIPPDQGGLTFVVPRRNNGPIVQVSFDPSSPTPLTGISVAFTGWGATQEFEAFRGFAKSSSMQDFKNALQFFDFGSQNWVYADVNGNIAYYTSGELPIRQDLQTLFFPAGLITPNIIRDGTNTNPHDWYPLTNPQPHQSLPTEILPFDEMPQIENPAAGFILNANNDPVGTTLDNIAWNQYRAGFNGVLYLSSSYSKGFRMGRLKRLFGDAVAAGPISTDTFAALQANNQLLDAEVFTPFLLDAWANATAPGAAPELAAIAADPRLAEAIGRLAEWDFSTPTGIDIGWDPGDVPGVPGPATPDEIDASVAATIYAVWRGQTVQRVIDGTLASLPVPLSQYAPGSDLALVALRQLLDNYPSNGGTGASLINFFNVPGIPDQDVARDVILLGALQSALDLLASDTFANAFGNSTDQSDYRWGLLHRIVFDNVLSPLLSIPPAGSPSNVSPLLPGFARAGGLGSLDAASHSARADGVNEFMFGSGPSRRFIATMAPSGPQALQVIPGGESGNAGNPHQADQLALWLVNAYKPLPVPLDDAIAGGVDTEDIVCGDAVRGPGEECDDGNSDNGDGCTDQCMLAPVVTCLAPAVPAGETCSAAVSCDVIASCTDVDGSTVMPACSPGGPYGPGGTDVGITCGAASTTCSVTVVDDTPPTLELTLDPEELWPPNHRMVDVTAYPVAEDACGTATVTLLSIESSEPDNATGNGDGDTDNDIQDAAVGTGDLVFELRAERAGTGPGRTYTVTYAATDAAGNETTAEATVFVPHDKGGVTEPLMIEMSKGDEGTRLAWSQAPGSGSYNVIRGRLADLIVRDPAYDLGTVHCIESSSPNENTDGDEDADVPEPGEVFIYMVDYGTTVRSAYGTVSADKPRFPRLGDCE